MSTVMEQIGANPNTCKYGSPLSTLFPAPQSPICGMTSSERQPYASTSQTNSGRQSRFENVERLERLAVSLVV